MHARTVEPSIFVEKQRTRAPMGAVLREDAHFRICLVELINLICGRMGACGMNGSG